jgi:hypothetical protein
MQAIALLGPEFLAAIRAAQAAGCAPSLVADALRLGSALSGKPGDGAWEVYRDLGENLRQTDAFIARWNDDTNPGSKQLVSVARRIHQQLTELANLVDAAPPDVIQTSKAGGHAGQHLAVSEVERYDFAGSNALMLAAFGVVALLRYLEIIELSWYLVIPIGMGVAVLTAALVSTIRFSRRRR